MTDEKSPVERVYPQVESGGMTREQIYWAIALNISAAVILLIFLQPVLEWMREKLFGWLLSLNKGREAAYYQRLAKRRLDYTNLILFGFLGTLCFSFSLPHHLCRSLSHRPCHVS
jgi:hypothetical protein